MMVERNGSTAQVIDVRELGADRAVREVRPEIVSSWIRSSQLGLVPDRFRVREHEGATDSLFVRAAKPVVDQMATDLASVEVAVLLTDSLANVLVRSEGTTGIGQRLDRISLAPGYVYAENTVGTNAIGTTLAVGSPTQVFGVEHFIDVLTNFSCAAAPVHDPGSGDVLGAIDLTSTARDASPLMLGLARTAAREIERQFQADSHSSAGIGNGRRWEFLTEAERRVAVLVSRGLSNREVANLVLSSRHTVDSHLRSIYRKIGVNKRAALAAYVAGVSGPSPLQP